MSLARRSLALVAVGALTASALTIGTASAEPLPPVARADHGPDVRPTMAAGVIVKTTTATASDALVRAADRALPSGVDVTRVSKSASGRRTSLFPTSRRMTAAEAETVAAELRERSDVVWAAPNYILRPFAPPPVPANDPYFRTNFNKAVWDWRDKTDSRVKSALGSTNSFGSGGFSSRAPYAWRATFGADATVAVLDTGITPHVDLDSSRVLSGRDFVSRFDLGGGELEDTGRDGDGWDPNPLDDGDWEGVDYCYWGAPEANSSWHGTHVAGIIAAEKNNLGMVGVAPEANILPVRVLGLCGGTFDDFAAAMRWSVGLPVTDPLTGDPVPVNENPADVVNMSLGGYASCTGPDAVPMIEAVAAVRSTGAVVVASAGNDGRNMSTYPVMPASCADVIAVGATSEYGDRAGYRNYKGTKSVYSNYGSAVDVVAPGGDVYWTENGGIRSTVNEGETDPIIDAQQTYRSYIGTSMSAPVVSSAAAILKSIQGDLTADQTEAAIRASVQTFPRGTHSQFRPCTTSICGKGIIDLSKIQAPSTPTTIAGQPIIGEPLTAARGSWSRIPTAFTYQWFSDDTAIDGATGATYHPTHDDVGKAISVRMSPVTAAYAPLGSTSAPTSPVPDGPEVTMTGLPSTLKYGVGATATVTVSSDGSPVDGEVELRRGDKVLARQAITGGTAEIAIEGTKWVAGSNLIRAAFVANETTPTASSAGSTVSVSKAISVVSTTLPTSVRYTSRATIGIKVTVAGVPAPTGQLRIYDGSKKIVYAVLASSAGGKRSIVLPRLSKGYHYIKVVYSGSSVISGDTSTTRRIKSY